MFKVVPRKYVYRNPNGFGLVQVIISLGLMMIVMMGATSVMSQMWKAKTTQQTYFERDSMGNYLKSLIRSQSTCSAGIDKNMTVLSTGIPNELKVSFRWPDLEIWDGVELPKYRLAVQKIYVKAVRSVGVSNMTGELFYLGELMIQEKALQSIHGGKEFKERSLGALNFATLANGVMSKCSQAYLEIPKLEDLKGASKDAELILQEAGLVLPPGNYPPEKITDSCDLKCVVDNFYARNNLSAESKANFYNHPTWQQVATNYSTLASAIAKAEGKDAVSAPRDGVAGLDNEILNNPLITERTLDGLAHAVSESGVDSVSAFIDTQGANNTAIAASLISANGGYTSGSSSSSDLNYLYNTAVSAGVTPAQAEAYFNGGGTIEQLMQIANDYNAEVSGSNGNGGGGYGGGP